MRRKDEDISFLGSVVLRFRSIKSRITELHLLRKLLNKQKEFSGYNGENSPCEAKLSYAFSIAKLCSISLLCILIVAVLVFGGSIFSYENVYYMFKDIGYISSFSESRPETLSYSQPFSNQDFSEFKNGLAVAGDSEIKFFTSTGRTTLSEGSGYTNPKICASDSYVLIYDQGKNSYTVYNSFIKVHSETLDYPISCAAMADDGGYCIVTSSGDYGSVVRVYNNKFALDYQYFKNDHIISAELSPNGKHLAVVSLDASMGEGLASLNVIKGGSDAPAFKETFRDVLPYRVSFLNNDRVLLVCADEAFVYDLSGNRKNSFTYPDELSYLSVAQDSFALLFSDNTVKGGNTLAVFDSNGSLIYSGVTEGRVNDMQLMGERVYLLCDSFIQRIDVKFRGSVKTDISVNEARLLVFRSGDVLLCTSNSAHYISFKD